MRPAIFIVAAAALAASACSRSDTDRMSHQVADTGKDIRQAAHGIAANSDVAKVKTDLKRMGAEVGRDLRQGAAETKASVQAAATDARKSTHDLVRRSDRNG